MSSLGFSSSHRQDSSYTSHSHGGSERSYASGSLGHRRSSSYALFDVEADPPLDKGVMPTSSEYDMMRETMFIKDGVDRSSWYSRIMNEEPEIRNFVERVDPVARAATFGRLYLPSARHIDQSTLLALISQHIRTLGLVDSQSSLHDEWAEQIHVPSHMSHSQLNLLVQRGMRRAERFWDLSMPSSMPSDKVSKLLDEEISRTIGGTPYIVEDATPLSSETPRDPRFFKTDENGEPTEVSLNQLILMMTTDGKQNGGPLLIPAICLNYKSFTTSKIFFTKIRERFRSAFAEQDKIKQEENKQEENKQEENKQIRIIALTFKLFKQWIKDPQDSIEQPVMEAARVFVETELRPKAPNFCANLFVTQGPSTPTNDVMDYSNAPKVELYDAKGLWSGNFTLFDIPPIEIARQMTIMSSIRYCAISRSELLDNAWATPRFKHRAPNVCALTDQTNRICAWVQTEILTEVSLQKRLAKMRFLIEVMAELEKMKNYLDLFNIFEGFNAPPIFRLNQHKAKLPSDMQQLLDRVAEAESPLNNYAVARQLHQEALQSMQPCLPHLPVLLGDIFKYNDNTKAMVDGLINLRKCYRMLTLIQCVEDFKRRRYCFLPIDQVLTKLGSIQGMDEDSLMELSFDVEPMEAGPNQLKDSQ